MLQDRLVLIFDWAMEEMGLEPVAGVVDYVNGDQVDVRTSDGQVDCWPIEWVWVRPTDTDGD